MKEGSYGLKEGSKDGLAWSVSIAAALFGFAPHALAVLFIVFCFFLLTSVILNRYGTEIFKYVRQAKKQLWDYYKSIYRVNLWRDFLFKNNENNNPFIIVILAFWLYLLLNAFWISGQSGAYHKVLYLGVIIVGYGFWHYALAFLSQDLKWQMVRGLVLGVLASMLYLLIDLYDPFLITNFIFNDVPTLLGGRHTHHDFPSFFLNRKVTALNIIFWPVLLAALGWNGALYGQVIRKIVVAGLVIGIILITFKSESESAKLALFLSVIIFIISFYKPSLCYRILQIFWGFAIIATVPIMILSYNLSLQTKSSLPFSAKERIYIWHYIAKDIPKHWLTGIGVRASRIGIKNNKSEEAQKHPALYPHNLFLQVWYELGAIGAAFLFLLGLALLEAIQKTRAALRPFLYANFSMGVLILCFGYGIWQSWILAGFGWTALFSLLVTDYIGFKSEIASKRKAA